MIPDTMAGMADEAWSRLARLIRDRREDKRMSQQELAQAADTTDRFIRSVEKAERVTFNRGTLRAIAVALGWTSDSIDRILGGGTPVLEEEREEHDAKLEERVDELEQRLDDVKAERDIEERFDRVEDQLARLRAQIEILEKQNAKLREAQEGEKGKGRERPAG